MKKECPNPKAVCTFTFPDGTKCNGPHIEKYCWYKFPDKCRDEKIRDNILKKIIEHSEKAPDSSDDILGQYFDQDAEFLASLTDTLNEAEYDEDPFADL